MSSELALAIRQLVQERGISEDLVQRTIEESLLAAYRKKFGSAENAVVRFSEDGDEVTVFAQKRIVDEVEDPVSEISLQDALEFNEESEIGDELLIEINPREFDRAAIQSAKQRTKQALREIQKDTLYSEFKDKVGEMIIGYYQRERNGTIYVDLGKTEGIFPKRFQSPREFYHANDRIKALIYEVTKGPNGLQIVLSRTHSDFVKRIFELEVPEIYDHTVEVFKIVREPGYRTKIAVYSNRDDVDPVGACVGLKGVRIQAVVREMEGEKIDVLKYDPDPATFIKNALSPVDVLQVVLLDESKKQALAVVAENQFSLAIGKQGLNVRLANRLSDWNIDVKTEQQFAEMDITAATKKAVSALFGEVEEPEEEITRVSELPGVPDRLIKLLKEKGLDELEELVTMKEEALAAVEGISPEDAKAIMQVIEDNVEIVEEEEEAAEEAPADEEQGEAGEEAAEAEEVSADETAEAVETAEAAEDTGETTEAAEETAEAAETAGRAETPGAEEPEEPVEASEAAENAEEAVVEAEPGEAETAEETDESAEAQASEEEPIEAKAQAEPEVAAPEAGMESADEEIGVEEDQEELLDEERPEEAAASEEAETYECPECGGVITADMTSCPNCGVGLSFEEEEEEVEETEE